MCFSFYYFVLSGRIAWRIISSHAPKHNKFNLHAFPLYFNVIISYSFKIARPGEKRGSVQGADMSNNIFTHNSCRSWNVAVDSRQK